MPMFCKISKNTPGVYPVLVPTPSLQYRVGGSGGLALCRSSPLLRIFPKTRVFRKGPAGHTTAGRGAGSKARRNGCAGVFGRGLGTQGKQNRVEGFDTKQRGFERGCDAGGEKIEATVFRFGIRVKKQDCERGGVLSCWKTPRMKEMDASCAILERQTTDGALLDDVGRGLGNRFGDFLTRMLSRVCLFRAS